MVNDKSRTTKRSGKYDDILNANKRNENEIREYCKEWQLEHVINHFCFNSEDSAICYLKGHNIPFVRGYGRIIKEQSVREFAKTHTLNEIVDEFDFSSDKAAYHFMKLKKIEYVAEVDNERYKEYSADEIKKYIEEEHSVREVFDHFEFPSVETMNKYLIEIGIPEFGRHRKGRKLNRDKIYLYASNHSMTDVALEFGFNSEKTVQQYCTKYKIPYVRKTSTDLIAEPVRRH